MTNKQWTWIKELEIIKHAVGILWRTTQVKWDFKKDYHICNSNFRKTTLHMQSGKEIKQGKKRKSKQKLNQRKSKTKVVNDKEIAQLTGLF